MPVDLTCIPDRAERRAPPSVKRWLVFLLALIAIDGLLTTWLWSTEESTHTPFFWLCFPGGAIITWILLIMARWSIFLAPSFSADGWDDAREEDIAQEIQRGQRSMVVQAHIVHLPHVVTFGSLSGQLLLPDGISLPPVIDPATQNVIHQARFDDVTLSEEDRLAQRLYILLSDGRLQSAIHRLPPDRKLAISLQTGDGELVSQEQRLILQQLIQDQLGIAFRITFLEEQGLGVLDRWLDDESDSTQSLLVVALNLSGEEVDGVGEAAVALLLSPPEEEFEQAGMVSLHRPEQTDNERGMSYALQQALQWGMSSPDEMGQLWLTGTGTTNKAEGLFSGTGIRFPTAGQPCDIDLRTGYTGGASPWLAISAAADNIADVQLPQLVMSVSEENILPWFLIVRP